VVSFTPQLLYPWGKIKRLMERKLGSPQSWYLDTVEKRNLS
jgi:hypothetical protein